MGEEGTCQREGGICVTSRAIFNFVFLLLASSFIYALVAQILGGGQLNDWPFSIFVGNQAASEHQGQRQSVFWRPSPAAGSSGQAERPDSCSKTVNILYSK